MCVCFLLNTALTQQNKGVLRVCLEPDTKKLFRRVLGGKTPHSETTSLQKKLFLNKHFCLVFKVKYLKILKSRYI